MLAKEKITKIVEKWYLLEPLYFAVWTLHKVEPSIRVKTIKIDAGHIKYNPIFIDKLSSKELNEVLSFEAMRIILKHPYRRKKEIAQISYQASNITVQEYLKTKLLGFVSAEEYFGSDDFDRKHFELYYDKIIEFAENENPENNNEDTENSNEDTENNNEDTENSNEGSENNNEDTENSNGGSENNNEDTENSNGGIGNNSEGIENSNGVIENNSEDTENSNEGTENNNENKPLENSNQSQNDLSEYTDKNKTGYENANNWDKNEYEEQLINDKIKDVQLSNSWGSITGNIQEQILATLKPKINYRTILKSFRASVLSNSRRLTRMKPSRRYGFLYMGSKRDFTTKLLFAVDISGSVDSYALKNAFSILNRFFKYGIEEISVICFDTEIKGELLTLKKAKKEIQIYGRGGTDFNAVIDYINKNKDYDGVIIFTDGYALAPKKPKHRKTKILWLFDNEYNYKMCKTELSKLGKVAFVKES